MREILFRAKRLADQKWIYGDFIMMLSDYPRIISNEDVKMYSVVSETVGQYTELTDKNGTKIFEGDVVDILTENEEFGVVEYDDGGFEVSADGFIVDFHTNINGTDLEVIGNIYDNPELIGGEANG